MTQTFATLADLQTRYPRELLTLAADEETGVLDAARVEGVLDDVTAEILSILLARYSSQDLGNLDDNARAVLRVYAMAMALYRVALSFARSTDRLAQGYADAVKALQGIAAGKGALNTVGGDGATDAPDAGTTEVGNGTVLVEASERMFTRDRTRGL